MSGPSLAYRLIHFAAERLRPSWIGLCLGFVRLRRVAMSGVALGVVVALVNGFESVSGVRPAYETHRHGLVHDLGWLILVAPAITGAGLSRFAARALSTRKITPPCP